MTLTGGMRFVACLGEPQASACAESRALGRGQSPSRADSVDGASTTIAVTQPHSDPTDLIAVASAISSYPHELQPDHPRFTH